MTSTCISHRWVGAVTVVIPLLGIRKGKELWRWIDCLMYLVA